MARYGIRSPKALGVPVPKLRAMAREIGPSHALALGLWSTEVLEARMLAAMIDEPTEVTDAQLEHWVEDLDNWALCDGCCSDLFRRTSLAFKKSDEWTQREPEFVKRAGFALAARLAFHDRNAPDAWFLRFLRAIEREADDDRHYVKKGVNWALREVGKRNPVLHRAAIRTAHRLRARSSRSARWIASDALRELESPDVLSRLTARTRSSRSPTLNLPRPKRDPNRRTRSAPARR